MFRLKKSKAYPVTLPFSQPFGTFNYDHLASPSSRIQRKVPYEKNSFPNEVSDDDGGKREKRTAFPPYFLGARETLRKDCQLDCLPKKRRIERGGIFTSPWLPWVISWPLLYKEKLETLLTKLVFCFTKKALR
ncbi:hypothetical protein CEXT_355521 [Caerostris extrusa]|uniref:Uncharacterized protein n=1 Tax=Caerostris extrusa TaxID=172846 RepID=A0AAV4RK86_CAEEX|nr:hypothetical protein CEXT_355521 [Caerostris extrusa]